MAVHNFVMVAVVIAALLAGRAGAGAAEAPVYGPRLEGFDYPYSVQHHSFESQRQKLSMAYMDIAPKSSNGRTVLLLHGKNFCGATWADTVEKLKARGYRSVVPDQIGFCKSSKPENYQYSFHQLAANTRALLASRKIDRTTVIGHSMGGMLAIRYALMFPRHVEQLILINPIGLEDWKAQGVPFRSVDDLYRGELKKSTDSIKRYQLHSYYDGDWKPPYDRWVSMLAGMYAGKGREKVAWSQALTSDMVFTQPVIYELENLTVPTVLLIGGRDRTAIGKDRVGADVVKRLGNYPELGRAAARRIPKSILVEFADLGHVPHIEAPERFYSALLQRLAQPGEAP